MSVKNLREIKIVPVAADFDLDASGSPYYTDSINMKNYHEALFIVNCGDLAVATTTITAYSGAADATYTSTLTFNYAWGGAAASVDGAGGTANCDVFATWTAATSVALTHGTYDDYTLLIQVSADVMDIANQEEWLALCFTDAGGSTGLVTCHALLMPRYRDASDATALS